MKSEIGIRNPFSAFHRDFVNPPLVASAFEAGGEKLGHNAVGLLAGDEAARHDEHVGVVVPACQTGNLRYPADGGPDALMLVQGDADAFAAAADGDAGVAFARLDGQSQGVGEVGIVTALGGIGAEVLVSPAAGVEPLPDVLFQLEACVVGC